LPPSADLHRTCSATTFPETRDRESFNARSLRSRENQYRSSAIRDLCVDRRLR
jgi:hypothetical protein